MRVLYLGDTMSPHFRAWPEHFAGQGYDVHTMHLGPRPEGEPVTGTTPHGKPRSSDWGRGRWLAGAIPVRDLVRSVEPDLVHSQQIVPGGVLCELAGVGPHVTTAWGSEVLKARRLARWPIGRVARHADLLTVNSQLMYDALVRHGASRDRLRWIPWGVSAAWRAPALAVTPADARARVGLPSDRPIVLSHRGTGAIYRQQDFVRAMGELRARGLDALGVIVTLELDPRAPEADGVRGLVARLGLQDAIRLVPPYEHREMAFAYRAASVCVSVPEHESAPNSVIEAISVGAPTIVSDLPWVHEPVYRDARLSVVPVGDHVALAAAIEAAIRRPGEEDARLNRELIDGHFDRGRVFAALGRDYDRLVGETRN